MNIKVPFDRDYVDLIGKAVYVFSYYEWGVIYIIDHFSSGFVRKCCQGTQRMTSGRICKKFHNVLTNNISANDDNLTPLQNCFQEFSRLIPKRDALIHAHPCTTNDGQQRLAYQADPSGPISDMLWEADDVRSFIAELDAASVRAGKLLDQLRSAGSEG